VSGLTLETAFQTALDALPPSLLDAPIGVAVSGGSDSLCLLLRAQDWAARAGARIVSLTVDHGLRAEAVAEAEAVAAHCRALGIAHRTLRLEGAAPRQAALRRARHGALAKALRSMGGTLLLTGHTEDDQAETFLMRVRQGSGWYGLAGMRALSLSPVWPEGQGVWIARPLLGARRTDLRAWLKTRGVSWAEDPSNDNPAFERVRMRTWLGQDVSRHGQILSLLGQFRSLRDIEDQLLAQFMSSHVRIAAGGLVVTGLGALLPERGARALGLLIQIAAGRETPPRGEGLHRLASKIVNESGFRDATLGGGRLIPRRDGLHIVAEVPDLCEMAGNRLRAGRLAAVCAMLSKQQLEIDAAAGKESFLHRSVPIF